MGTVGIEPKPPPIYEIGAFTRLLSPRVFSLP